MSLSELSTEHLYEARIELDHQIAALRERKLAIAREIEARFPEPEMAERPAQTVAPGFIESEAFAFSPGDPEPDIEPLPDKPEPRRRWWRA